MTLKGIVGGVMPPSSEKEGVKTFAMNHKGRIDHLASQKGGVHGKGGL